MSNKQQKFELAETMKPAGDPAPNRVLALSATAGVLLTGTRLVTGQASPTQNV